MAGCKAAALVRGGLDEFFSRKISVSRHPPAGGGKTLLYTRFSSFNIGGSSSGKTLVFGTSIRGEDCLRQSARKSSLENLFTKMKFRAGGTSVESIRNPSTFKL